MSDRVLDATIIAFSSSDLAAREQGNSIDLRLTVIEEVVKGDYCLRYNARLLHEYRQVSRGYQNDVTELFFRVLDSSNSILVQRSSLARQHFAVAVTKCGWPSHDQHLIAAALNGANPEIFVTEQKHAICAQGIYRNLGIRICHINKQSDIT